ASRHRRRDPQPRCRRRPRGNAQASYQRPRALSEARGGGRPRMRGSGAGKMRRVLLTGAAGGVGTTLRKLLKDVYTDLRLSDIAVPKALGKDERFAAADLADMAAVEKVVKGVDGIIHLGGVSVEKPWEMIHRANIVGCYNLFEAARRHGVKRVVFASSNHAVGF